MTKFQVKHAKNGFILKSEDGDTVYQTSYDNEQTDIERFVEFLWALNQQYGPQTSRYSKERIIISVEPGDKYEET